MQKKCLYAFLFEHFGLNPTLIGKQFRTRLDAVKYCI